MHNRMFNTFDFFIDILLIKEYDRPIRGGLNMSVVTMTLTNTLPVRIPRFNYKEASDYELCQLGIDDDHKAFEEIYNRHHRKVYCVCVRMVKNSTIAEDLTQNVFLKLYLPSKSGLKRIATFRGNSQFSTWIHRMTVNEVLMYFRKNEVRLEETGEEEDTVEKRIETRTKIIPNFDAKIELEKAIDQLPPGYRRTYELHDIEGYQHDEVAERMGCSVGTAKSQLHKARLKLRKIAGKIANPRKRRNSLNPTCP